MADIVKTEPGTASKNIQSRAEGSSIWNGADVLASLDGLFTDVLAEARRSEQWYWRSKGSKALWSRTIKWGVVVLTGLGAVVPVAVSLRLFPWLTVYLHSVVSSTSFDSGLFSSLLIGCAAALLGFDRAWGFSTGWARYVLTGTAIRNAAEEFRMDWTMLSAQLASPPTTEQLTAMIQRAKAFRMTVEALVLKETQDWATEFQSNLAQMEKDLKLKVDKAQAEREKVEQDRAAAAAQAAAASRPGSIELVVPNAARADDFRWTVRLQSKEEELSEELVGAKNWAHIGVAPGQYKLTVTATVGKRPARASAVLGVKPGEAVKVELALTEPARPEQDPPRDSSLPGIAAAPPASGAAASPGG